MSGQVKLKSGVGSAMLKVRTKSGQVRSGQVRSGQVKVKVGSCLLRFMVSRVSRDTTWRQCFYGTMA